MKWGCSTLSNFYDFPNLFDDVGWRSELILMLYNWSQVFLLSRENGLNSVSRVSLSLPQLATILSPCKISSSMHLLLSNQNYLPAFLLQSFWKWSLTARSPQAQNEDLVVFFQQKLFQLLKFLMDLKLFFMQCWNWSKTFLFPH